MPTMRLRQAPDLTPIALTAVAVGAWLLYATVTGQPVTGSIKAALTGQPRPARERLTVGSSAGGTGSGAVPGSAGTPTSSISEATTSEIRSGRPVLVPIDQGSHKLSPRSATAFKAWQTAYGAVIPITDSYRDWDTQARQHAKDPDRFVAPQNSAHVLGDAVDVNMGAVNVPRLITAAKATGWCQAAVNKKPTPEPWHFSYGGCK